MRELFTTLFVFAAAVMLWRTMRPPQQHDRYQVASPSQPHPGDALDADSYKWPSLGLFRFPVAETGRHQEALRQVVDSTPMGSNGIRLVVQLHTGSTNPDVWRPVEVRAHGLRVGYLSAGDASRFLRRLAYEGHTGETTCCDAVISRTDGSYDIRLDLKEFRH